MEKLPLYWIWFAQLNGISLFDKQRLLQHFSDPEELFAAEEKTLQEIPVAFREALSNHDLTEATQILDQCKQKGIKILTFADTTYPQNLRNIEDPPLVLYFKGSLPDWQAQPLIGIVGTRKASPYGLQTAGLLASQVAACGGMIVSGLAAGIDAAAMEGALAVEKSVVGVAANGLDIIYPARNRKLYGRTEECGCLISEYPPGTRPYPANFLHRNRIISGISQGILVVEAPERSGALNTARHAFTQGRDVFTVPANLGVDSSRGSNGLLQEGAYAVFTGWDVVKHYAPLYPNTVENRPLPFERKPAMVAQTPAVPEKRETKMETPAKNAIDNSEESTYSGINKRPQGLSEQETAILNLLSETPQLTDSVMDAAGLPFGTVQSILTRLTIKGFVRQYPDGSVSRK